MTVEHHPLTKDFPDLRERIHAMKVKGDAHFGRLEKQYEDLDKQIVRVENGIERTDATALEQLKQQRVHLKDQLYKLLTS